MWSKTGKKLTIIELTVPLETICDVVQDREEAHYHRTDSTIGDNL